MRHDDSAEEDRKRKYESKRQVKRVSFNTDTEPDLLSAANSIPDFSKWVKEKLRETLK